MLILILTKTQLTHKKNLYLISTSVSLCGLYIDIYIYGQFQKKWANFCQFLPICYFTIIP